MSTITNPFYITFSVRSEKSFFDNFSVQRKLTSESILTPSCCLSTPSYCCLAIFLYLPLSCYVNIISMALFEVPHRRERGACWI